MAMLAERRRKTKFVLNPVSKPLWSSESSGVQFGMKMMEKMGWSTGKGLGANEQGIQEPVRAVYKQNAKGIGFKGDGNPFHNQDEFNALLKSLGNEDTATETQNDAYQFESLEEKSKNCKTRVHYKKFTRGKDISRYSKFDLASIVGTGKKTKEPETPNEDEKKDDNSSNTFGVTTTNSGSIGDYFKMKFESKENKSVISNNNPSDGRKCFGFGYNSEGSKKEGNQEDSNDLKSKFQMNWVSGPVINKIETDEEKNQENNLEVEPKSSGEKKKRKKGYKVQDENDAGSSLKPSELDTDEKKSDTEVVSEEKSKKKKHKKHNISCQMEDSIEDVQVKKSKKKRSSKDCERDLVIIDPVFDEAVECGGRKKKKKKKSKEDKHKPEETVDDNTYETSNDLQNVVDESRKEKKKRKKKRKEKTTTLEVPDVNDAEETEEESRKKRKRKYVDLELNSDSVTEEKQKNKAEDFELELGSKASETDLAVINDNKVKKKRRKKETETEENLKGTNLAESSRNEVVLIKEKISDKQMTNNENPLETNVSCEGNAQAYEENVPVEEHDGNADEYTECDLNNLEKAFPGSNLKRIKGYGIS